MKANKRISALHLTLPLGRYKPEDEGEQEILVSVADSQWTVSAMSASTASAYSQDSYKFSPVPFSEAKIDRRRFALALSASGASWNAGWSAPIRDLQSPEAGTFVLDLHSATLEPEADDYVSNNSEDTLLKKVDTDGTGNAEKKSVALESKAEQNVDKDSALKETKKEIKFKEASRQQKKPRAKSVFGKMLSRLSSHPSQTSFSDVADEVRPLLPSLPPQLDISVPSPGLKVLQEFREPEITPADLVRSLQSANVPGNRATLPSTWKPRRPPSPIPKLLKKGKGDAKTVHKRNAASDHSPVPPLPTRRQDVPEQTSSSALTNIEVSTTGSVVQHAETRRGSPIRSSWAELQGRVKARAMKSAYYAVPETVPSSPDVAYP